MADYLNSIKIKTNMAHYFNYSDKKKTDKRVSTAIMHRIHNEFNDLFSGICCFKGTFSLQVKEGSHPYQAPTRRVAYVL